jgi:hypothetical protein
LDPIYQDPTWLTAAGLEDASVHRQYIAAFYWAVMTTTTVGYGDVTPQNYVEMVYGIFAMIFSGGCFAYIVGTMCTLVSTLWGLCARW